MKDWYLDWCWKFGVHLLNMQVQTLSFCPNFGNCTSCHIARIVHLPLDLASGHILVVKLGLSAFKEKKEEKKGGISSDPSHLDQEQQGNSHPMMPSLDGWSLRYVCGLEKEDGTDRCLSQKMPLTFSFSSFLLFLHTSPQPLLLTFMPGTRCTELWSSLGYAPRFCCNFWWIFDHL